MALVSVRYYGGAAAAAGSTTASADADTLGELLDQLAAAHSGALDRILGVASVLIDGTVVLDRSFRLADGQTVDVLPPFAGG